MQPVIVGLKGPLQSGKSTFAAMLREAAGSSPAADLEYSDLMMEAGNLALEQGNTALYPFVMNLLKGSEEVLGQRLGHPPGDWFWSERPDVMRELKVWHQAGLPPQLTRQTKDANRPVYSFLGYFVRRSEIGRPDIWAGEMDRRLAALPPEPLVTVGGVRFPEDAVPVRERGGLIFEVRRDHGRTDTDATNERRHEIVPDQVIDNSRSKEVLRTLALLAHRDLLDRCRSHPPAQLLSP